MNKYIILFRGINVGGNNLLPMKELVPLLESDVFEDVSSYIQSGNVVLKSHNNPSQAIKKIVFDNFGFTPELFIFDDVLFSVMLSDNPYQTFEGKFVHFYFCHNNIKLNEEKLSRYYNDSETYFVKGNIFYLHAPNGIGRSKLVTNIESCLNQPATGRNLNTVNKLDTLLSKM